ncbi:membrane-associating domain-containing protein [Dipodascopsis tothii]|uniref:membrane-associating domain-containing protein n=1 Tax=Dipodascopsis tothii TaxID=44089 RepID=UPI0034CDFC29
MGALFVSNGVLRGLTLVFLVICMGLTGSLIQGQDFGVPQVNFVMFACVFGLLFGVLYTFAAMFISAIAFPAVIALFDFLNAVFCFAGATALAVAMRVHSCTNHSYINSNKVSQGSTDRCRKGQADTVFLYFAFLTFLASLVLSISVGMREGWGTLPSKKSVRPAPTMTQVA